LTAEPYRCSRESLAIEEPMMGTASIVRSWLLIEQPGPWGYEAVRQNRMPDGVADDLRARAAALGIRIILLRRPGRVAPLGREVFLAHTGVTDAWLEHGHVAEPAELLDLDLALLAEGSPSGFGALEERPLYLVCTNGRRDICCAERGRPLARALEGAFGDRVWECSHIGGDRFAGNLVCFPHGIYFGRVAPEEGIAIADGYARGIIDLDHYRGRSCYAFAVQAAEHFLRLREGLRGLHDLRLVREPSLADGELHAVFATPAGEQLEIRLELSRAEPARRLTCLSSEGLRPPAYEPVAEE
jgi:hypothetical protein